MSLKEFLASANGALSDRSSPKRIHIVLCNESCDLDSTVSSITYAFFLKSICTDSNTIHLPVLNIPRGQFRLRLECGYLLGKFGLESELLTFIDDFSLADLAVMDGVTLTVTLTDHHVLKEGQGYLKDKITEVLDHRPVADDFPESWKVEIEPVGSCCTLVARRMLDHHSFTLDPIVVQLLIGAILLDTGNLSVKDQIATDTDHAVVMSLNSMLPDDISPRQIYEDIQRVKFDLSSLTVMEMLQKDMKLLRGSYIVVAMSSMTMDLPEVLSRPEFSHDASAFSAALRADATIIMTLVMGEESIASRCIAVYSASRVYREQLTDVLLSSTNPNLGLEMMELPARVEHVTAFAQNNTRISRKGVLPLIRDFLAGEATLSPDDDNMNALSVATSSEGEGSENIDEGNMQMRRHINLAKTAQSDQFRTSMDQFDLAAVGTNALISPSLSSDSECGLKSREESPESRLIDTTIEGVPQEPTETSPASRSTSNSSLLSSLMAKQEEEEAQQKVAQTNSAPDERLPGAINQIETEPINNAEDVLEMHSPFELLCPSTGSPLELLSLPASGQISGQESGQGSKVPSYPETPPNSYIMSPKGPGFRKQTQLPSFNSKEMEEKIQQKKRALNNRHRRDADEDIFDDVDVTVGNKSDGLDFFNVLTVNEGGLDSSGSGGGRSRGGGSLISPAVPQNSYVDLIGPFGQSPNYDIPTLARADIEEKVSEKRSQFEWDEGVPYTPQNSYVEGGAGALAMGSLTSFNNAEIVARIRAKQAAMFGSSGRASGSSEDSLGCHSPEGMQKSRGISLESPAQAYTPHNSYKDGLGILDGRGRLPDLNEVAERLSTEKFNHHKGNRRSASNSGGESRDEDGPGPGGGVLQKPGGRHSSSQSDSQNTMSDVESLMSVSTDFGTPSDNIVASSIAGAMRAEMMSLSRKDTSDSEVFTPGKPDEKPRIAFGFVSSDAVNDNSADKGQSEDYGEVAQNGDIGNGSTSQPGQPGDLFSPLDEKNMIEEEVQFFQAAENIVARSIAAAMEINQDCPLENGDISTSITSLTNQINSNNGCAVAIKEDDDKRKSGGETPPSSKVPFDTDLNPVSLPSASSDKSLSELSTDISSLSQEVSIKRKTDSDTITEPQKNKSALKSRSAKNRNIKDNGVSFSDKDMSDHDEKMAEAALSELAYEWARDLIQGVLDDFNLSQDGLEQESPRPNGTNEVILENGDEDLESRSELCKYQSEQSSKEASLTEPKPKEGVVDWSKVGKGGMVPDLSIVITAGDDGPSDQGERSSDLDEDVDGFSVEALDGSVGDFARDDTVDVDEDEDCEGKGDEKLEEDEEDGMKDDSIACRENRPGMCLSDDFSSINKSKTDRSQTEWNLPRGSSSSIDSNQNSGERKWSRETDTSQTIMEDEMLTNFPEWKSLPDDRSRADDEEEFITSFPGRKISLSEDYPRRFSREDDMSRRSSKIEVDEQNLENLVRPDGLETDYLPNMDPFQGSLDIISNEASISKMTDVDREVVEGESFRRVSGHELESNLEERIGEASSTKEKSSIEQNVDNVKEGVISKTSAANLEKEQIVEMIEKKNVFQEQSLQRQPSPTVPRKKRIRVSFSEEVLDDDGSSYQISPRSTLRSPPPPHSEHYQNKPSNMERAHGSAIHQDGKEIYFTTAGRISIGEEEEDSAFQSNSSEPLPSVLEDPILGQARAQVDAIMTSITETVRQAEDSMEQPQADRTSSSSSQVDSSVFSDHSTGPNPLNPVQSMNPSHTQSETHTLSRPSSSTEASEATVSQPVPADLHPLQGHSRQASATSMGSVKGAEYRDEWQDDNIQDVAQQAGVDTEITDNVRKKICADSNLVPGLGEEEEDEDDDDIDDEDDEEEGNDRDSDIGDLEWENDTPIQPPAIPGVHPVMTGDQSGPSQEQPQQRFKTVVTSGSTFNVDMELVGPYKSVLSHGGYFDEGLSAVIVFYGFNLPSRRQEDYQSVMNHLFHYVVHTLEELVADDYVIVYFHGSTPQKKMPGLRWLRRCYQCIDRRLKKNLKGLFLVHPTLWLRTIVAMTRPFISSKFSSKLKFVRNLDELRLLVPLENVTIPDAILHLEEILKSNPHYLEKQEAL